MVTIDALKDFGANVDVGIARCAGKEDLYLTLVQMLPTDGNFARLEAAIKSGDLDDAFEAAHSLKGVAGNLEISPIVNPVNEITEHLRGREDMDYTPLLSDILNGRDGLLKLCNS